jgi:hypothetical protein
MEHGMQLPQICLLILSMQRIMGNCCMYALMGRLFISDHTDDCIVSDDKGEEKNEYYSNS